MFTGIIKHLGKIVDKSKTPQAVYLTIESDLSPLLHIDQSVAHNGICLTITNIADNRHIVCAVQETIDKTSIAQWEKDDFINLETCISLHQLLDGHLVQGHIDTTAICKDILEENEHRIFTFTIDTQYAPYVIEKGSICVNGVSLTCFAVKDNEFSVAIIPYTYHHTQFKYVKKAEKVNIEFDVIGKYVLRHLQWQKK